MSESTAKTQHPVGIDPPRPRKWFLLVTSVMLLVWFFFLAWMAA